MKRENNFIQIYFRVIIKKNFLFLKLNFKKELLKNLKKKEKKFATIIKMTTKTKQLIALTDNAGEKYVAEEKILFKMKMGQKK